ncbi:MAG: nickel-responsive transcriptional regulator NikR, partial [Duodenibacillus sp.]|nr:nickel-responsive transcriptional regulator NikR [Duodenibacillus sp.]
MARFTISLDDELAGELDGLIARKGYLNRSEAFRDMLRRELAEQDIGAGGGRCVAVLSYAFDHRTRQLAERMTGHQHDHGDLVVSTMHVHIDHDRCVEAVVLRGPVEGVKRIASQMAAETGVEHGAVN